MALPDFVDLGAIIPAIWGITGVVMAVRMGQIQGPVSRKEATVWIAIALVLAALGVIDGARHRAQQRQSENDESTWRTNVNRFIELTTTRPGAVPAVAPELDTHVEHQADLEHRLRTTAGDIKAFTNDWAAKMPEFFISQGGSQLSLASLSEMNAYLEGFEPEYSRRFAERVSSLRRELELQGFKRSDTDKLRTRPRNTGEANGLADFVASFADMLP